MNFKVGETVEYLCVAGWIRPQIIKIKDNGDLILNTREEHTLLKPGKNGATTVSLYKNVCVLPHRVKKI